MKRHEAQLKKLKESLFSIFLGYILVASVILTIIGLSASKEAVSNQVKRLHGMAAEENEYSYFGPKWKQVVVVFSGLSSSPSTKQLAICVSLSASLSDRHIAVLQHTSVLERSHRGLSVLSVLGYLGISTLHIGYLKSRISFLSPWKKKRLHRLHTWEYTNDVNAFVIAVVIMIVIVILITFVAIIRVVAAMIPRLICTACVCSQFD